MIGPLSSHIIATSLCLITISLATLAIANLQYGYKHALKIVIRNTSIALIYKQLVSFNIR
jgi:hypothetical protein